MSNVIVVSNREPYEHNLVDDRVVCQRTDGGLVSALRFSATVHSTVHGQAGGTACTGTFRRQWIRGA